MPAAAIFQNEANSVPEKLTSEWRYPANSVVDTINETQHWDNILTLLGFIAQPLH